MEYIRAVIHCFVDSFRPRCYCGVKIDWFETNCGKEKCKEEDALCQIFGM